MPLAIPLPSLLQHETGRSSCTSTARVVEGIGRSKRYIVHIKERYNLPEPGGARRPWSIYEKVLKYVRWPQLEISKMFCHCIQQQHL